MGPKIRILIVDDSPYIRQAIRDMLEKDSTFDIVGEAANGHRALELADTLRPDIILIDYAMPYMNGLAAAKRIKKRYPETRIVMLSMYAADLVKEASGAGVCLCIGKDTDLRQLPQMLVGCHLDELRNHSG